MVTVFLLITGWHVRRSVCSGNRAAVAVSSEGMVVVLVAHAWNNLCIVWWNEWEQAGSLPSVRGGTGTGKLFSQGGFREKVEKPRLKTTIILLSHSLTS